MIVSAIQYNNRKDQKSNHMVKPVQTKQDSKDGSAENSYQLLLHQAMMVYQR